MTVLVHPLGHSCSESLEGLEIAWIWYISMRVGSLGSNLGSYEV